MTGTRILFVDDMPKEREVQPQAIKKVWQELYSETVEVVACSDLLPDGQQPGTQTMPFSSVGHFDLVLLDIVWGGKHPHGLEIAKEIRQRFPPIPIVAFSRHVTREHFPEIVRLRFDAYLSKQESSAVPWCAEIRRVLEEAARGRPGYPLFTLLTVQRGIRSHIYAAVSCGILLLGCSVAGDIG